MSLSWVARWMIFGRSIHECVPACILRSRYTLSKSKGSPCGVGRPPFSQFGALRPGHYRLHYCSISNHLVTHLMLLIRCRLIINQLHIYSIVDIGKTALCSNYLLVGMMHNAWRSAFLNYTANVLTSWWWTDSGMPFWCAVYTTAETSTHFYSSTCGVTRYQDTGSKHSGHHSRLAYARVYTSNVHSSWSKCDIRGCDGCAVHEANTEHSVWGIHYVQIYQN